jgi:hypothetical protein
MKLRQLKNQSTQKKENKEQNGRTHVQKGKWTTKKGKPQGEHQVPEPCLVVRKISNEEKVMTYWKDF